MITNEQYQDAILVAAFQDHLRFWEDEYGKEETTFSKKELLELITQDKKSLLELTGNERGFLEEK
jgi:hypothetical protein